MILLINLISKMRKKIFPKLFNIKQSEIFIVFMMFLHSFFLGFAIVYIGTVTNTLFLTVFNANILPYMYIIVALVVSLIGFLYSFLQRKFSFFNVITLNLLFLIIGQIILRSLLIKNSKPAVIILYIFWNVLWVLINLEFWSLANYLFDIRQSKRFFGLIGSGEMLAAVLGGLTIPYLVKIFSTTNLLFISIISIFICFLIILVIRNKYKDNFILSNANKNNHDSNYKTMPSKIKNNYIFLIICFSSLMIFSFYFIDNIFYKHTEKIFIDEAKLASYLGMFFALTGVVTFIFKLLISDKIIYKFGLLFGLIALPIVLFLFVSLYITMSISTVFVSYLYVIIVLIKLFESVLRLSINKSALLILYQPFPMDLRLKTQSNIESISDQIATGLAGVSLLLLISFCKFSTFKLSFYLIGILLLWLVVVLILFRKYKSVLNYVLTTHQLKFKTYNLDATSIKIIKKSFNSTNPEEIIYSLDLLEDLDHPYVSKILIKLIKHSDKLVRLNVLKRIRGHKLSNALSVIDEQLEEEKSPLVIGELLQTYAFINKNNVLEKLKKYLNFKDFNITKGVIVGLLINGNKEEVLYGEECLKNFINSKKTQDKILAARIIGEIKTSKYNSYIQNLIKDDDIGVKKESLICIGKLKNIDLFSDLISLLNNNKIYNELVKAAVSLGEKIIPKICLLLEKKEQDIIIKNKLISILGKIGGNKAKSFLLKMITIEDRSTFSNVLASLSSTGYIAKKSDREKIIERIYLEVTEAIWIIWVISILDRLQQADKLVITLRNIYFKIIENIFYLLSFLYEDSKLVLNLFNIIYYIKEKRAFAFEILDNLLTLHQKKIIFPLIDDISDEDRLNLLGNFLKNKESNLEKLLTELFHYAKKCNFDVLNSIVIYLIGELKISSLIDLVLESLNHNKLIVKESAVISLLKIDKKVIGAKKNVFKNITLLNIKNKYEQGLLNEYDLLINRIFLVKSTLMFSNIDVEVLDNFVEKLELIFFKKRAVIFKKGDIFNYMYIITKGHVNAISDDKTIATIGKSQTVGELALIDNKPRSATVITNEKTEMIRFDKNVFDNLINEETEVVSGIIKVLCERLRKLLINSDNKVESLINTFEEKIFSISEEKTYEYLMPIEKILLLKKVLFFNDLSKRDLEDIASVLINDDYKKGESIIKEGDVGNSMYIIVSGRVKVQVGDNVLNFLKKGSIFGELSVLDSEPRSANVIAEEYTQLLRLDQASLYELIYDRPELAFDIMKGLVRRIRIYLN